MVIHDVTMFPSTVRQLFSPPIEKWTSIHFTATKILHPPSTMKTIYAIAADFSGWYPWKNSPCDSYFAVAFQNLIQRKKWNFKTDHEKKKLKGRNSPCDFYSAVASRIQFWPSHGLGRGPNPAEDQSKSFEKCKRIETTPRGLWTPMFGGCPLKLGIKNL